MASASKDLCQNRRERGKYVQRNSKINTRNKQGDYRRQRRMNDARRSNSKNTAVFSKYGLDMPF